MVVLVSMWEFPDHQGFVWVFPARRGFALVVACAWRSSSIPRNHVPMAESQRHLSFVLSALRIPTATLLPPPAVRPSVFVSRAFCFAR